MDIKKMTGNPHFRVRVGQDRVVIDDLGRVIMVIDAGPRGSIYKRSRRMTTVQKLTIDGKNYVLLSEDDYEDLVDGLHASAILARVAAGEETWPYELVKELSETDSRIRTYREYRQLTISELAEAARISPDELSRIENDIGAGSVDELTRIAAALKIDLDDIVLDGADHQ